MELSQKPICVTSYNSTGLGLSSIKFIETLLIFSNILCIQEHFLQDAGDKKHSNTNKLRKSFKDHDMYITPAFKANNKEVVSLSVIGNRELFTNIYLFSIEIN